MKIKIIKLIGLLFITQLFGEIQAQEKTGFININVSLKSGAFTEYDLNIKLQYKGKLYKNTNSISSSVGIDMRIVDLKVTNIIYRGQNAKDLIGIKYPMSLNNPKINIELNDHYTYNSKTYSDNHKKFYNMTKSYYGNYYNGGFNNFEKTFGSNASFNKMQIELKNIKVLSLHSDEFASLAIPLAQNYEKKQEVNNLKNELNSHNRETIKELKDTRNKYVQLEKIEEKNYSKEIAQIDEKISELEKKNNENDHKSKEDKTTSNNTEIIQKNNDERNQKQIFEDQQKKKYDDLINRIETDRQENLVREKKYKEIGTKLGNAISEIIDRPQKQKVLVETTYNISDLQNKIFKEFDAKSAESKSEINRIMTQRKAFFNIKNEVSETHNEKSSKLPIYIFIAYCKKGYDDFTDKTDYENLTQVSFEYDMDSQINFSPIFEVHSNSNGKFPYLREIYSEMSDSLNIDNDIYEIKYYQWTLTKLETEKLLETEKKFIDSGNYFKSKRVIKTITINKNQNASINYWNTKN